MKIVLGLSLAVFALVLAIEVGWRIKSSRYADHVFRDRVPYSEVLASRLRAPFSEAPPLECTHAAVVKLVPSAPGDPPLPSRSRRYPYDFGGNWQRGPSPWFDPENPSPGDSDRVAICAHRHLSDKLIEQLRKAAREPSAFWASSGCRYYLYAPTTGIAATIRFNC